MVAADAAAGRQDDILLCCVTRRKFLIRQFPSRCAESCMFRAFPPVLRTQIGSVVINAEELVALFWELASPRFTQRFLSTEHHTWSRGHGCQQSPSVHFPPSCLTGFFPACRLLEDPAMSFFSCFPFLLLINGLRVPPPEGPDNTPRHSPFLSPRKHRTYPSTSWNFRTWILGCHRPTGYLLLLALTCCRQA